MFILVYINWDTTTNFFDSAAFKLHCSLDVKYQSSKSIVILNVLRLEVLKHLSFLKIRFQFLSFRSWNSAKSEILTDNISLFRDFMRSSRKHKRIFAISTTNCLATNWYSSVWKSTLKIFLMKRRWRSSKNIVVKKLKATATCRRERKSSEKATTS